MTLFQVNSEVIQWTYGAMIYRTRYLPLREEGVDKVVSISVSKADALSYYAALLCFLVICYFSLGMFLKATKKGLS